MFPFHSVSFLSMEMKSLCIRSREPLPWGGGGGHFHSKVIGMLVVFLEYKILILIFFRVYWKFFCKNEIQVFYRSAHFPYSVNMRSFQNVFSKIGIFRVLHQQFGYFLGFKIKIVVFLGFSKKKFRRAYLSLLH